MAFDGSSIHCLVSELNRELTGGRISKIAQPEALELQLTIKTAAGNRRLLISANASLPLIYLTEENKTAPLTAPVFCMLLRKHIQGGHISSIEQIGFERVIRIRIRHMDELGDPAEKQLYIEIMGKHSNIIFCDQEDKIIDAIKRVPFSLSSVREVLPGRDYFIPAQEGRHNPLNSSQEEFISAVFSSPRPLVKAIYSAYTGFSPVIANEILCRAGLSSANSSAELTEIQQIQLYGAFDRMMTDLGQERFSPCLIRDAKSGAPREYAAFCISFYPKDTLVRYESISRLLVDYYAGRNRATNMQQKSSDLRHLLTTLLDRNRKKEAIQKKQLKDTEKMDLYRVRGELLHTYGYSARPGDRSLTCVNYYDNKEIVIPLDPLLSAQENAARCFARYEKLKRTKDASLRLIEETSLAIAHLESMLTALDLAENSADLEAVHQEMIRYGYIKKKGKGKKIQGKSKPLHYVTEDGYDIYVGKNNEQNDYLTFKVATGNDWWFHAKKIHGSHVIVKNPAGGEMPDQVYEIAASLAAYYSQGRESGSVEVDYLQKKKVKKPAGAVAGFVVYYSNYSLLARPSTEGARLVD